MRTRRQALGQHFLHDQLILEKIADAVDEKLSNDSAIAAIVEVGPGKLALTHHLVSLAKAHNLPLTLVERDKNLESEIRLGVNQNAEIHFLDAATDAFSKLLQEISKKAKGKILLVSNLPYSASSQILAQACYSIDAISGCIVMMQKELAERMGAEPGSRKRGAFSLFIQGYFQMKPLFDVSPKAFNPPPKVMSSVIQMTPQPHPISKRVSSPQNFEKFCKHLFSQKRKMIRKILPPESLYLIQREGLTGTERPETLKLETILSLYGKGFKDS